MLNKFYRCQVVTKEKIVFDDDITSLIAPGVDGYFGILVDHYPMIALLGKGELKLKIQEDENKFDVKEGVLEVQKNHVTILADLN